MTWKKIDFPADKAEIERLIMNIFVRETSRHGFVFKAVKQNEENNFDFTLELPGGVVDMDLVEFVFRDGQGRPYDDGETRIETYKLAEQLCDLVSKKAMHYGKSNARPIHLLVYATHWRFFPNEIAFRLVQHFLQRSSVFENVFFLAPHDQESAELRVLAPSENPLEGRNPEEFRDHWYLNLDPGKAILVSGTN